MNIITANPDEWPSSGGRILKYGGSNWLASISKACVSAFASTASHQYYAIDLGNLEFVTLSAWVGMVALLERLVANPLTTSVGIDLKGASPLRVLPPSEYLDTEIRQAGDEKGATRSQEFLQARRMYKIGGFLESLGTRTVLNIAGRGDRINYTWLGEEGARLKAFATRLDGSQTVVSRIKKPWPFAVLVECWLSGRRLARKMDFRDGGSVLRL
jgi:hypothetical protein